MHCRVLIGALVGCFTFGASADEDRADLLYGCDIGAERIELGPVIPENMVELESIGYAMESFTSFELIQYSPEDENGNVYRTGSSALTKECGPFKVVIRGGFLNSNPGGELGAVTFPLIEVLYKGKSLIGQMALGSCDTSNGRYSYEKRCPEEWATSISLFPKHTKNGVVVHLFHSYAQYINIP
jgi:hypothetical protein